LNTENLDLAQNSDERKKAIAKAVKTKHDRDKVTKNRCDVYIEDETHHGLKRIKATFDDVKNKDQAVDRAVKLALEKMDEEKD